MIEYILNYVTKGQKGMSSQMEKACKDANKGNMDLKQSVQHIGNVFLSAVETGQEEAAFLILQAAMTFMRQSVFINTSPPSERTFLVKSKKQLEQLDPYSTDIAVDNLIRCIGLKWPMSQMAYGILKFMISHLGPGSNVQLCLVDFKVLQSAN